VKIDISADEAEAVRTALEHFKAYLKSQQREEAKYLRLEDLFRKLAGSERR